MILHRLQVPRVFAAKVPEGWRIGKCLENRSAPRRGCLEIAQACRGSLQACADLGQAGRVFALMPFSRLELFDSCSVFASTVFGRRQHLCQSSFSPGIVLLSSLEPTRLPKLVELGPHRRFSLDPGLALHPGELSRPLQPPLTLLPGQEYPLLGSLATPSDLFPTSLFPVRLLSAMGLPEFRSRLPAPMSHGLCLCSSSSLLRSDGLLQQPDLLVVFLFDSGEFFSLLSLCRAGFLFPVLRVLQGDEGAGFFLFGERQLLLKRCPLPGK